MKLLSKTALLLVAALALTAPVARAETKGEVDAATQAKITAELTAQGYEVRKIGTEDGRIEVYAIKDGKTAELYLDENLKIIPSTD
ncbi:MAG: PepSY domain-containing protein [Cereibacter sphaeroides]|uniref:PepSY domain-containing protein n=1 Tax=Cereibacter sphaeroides TaxID=1063 RepID=A0A2W5SC69_CERSP|nr:MAG: PepSY domain-containing protein [Cereibacter sphaeroides]